jgi:PAS domain S-box-containing protein
MSGSLRNSGIAPVGPIAWGTHFCHFFETNDDLCDTVVPYFAAGLEAHELCFWLLSDLTPAQCVDEWRRRATIDIESHVSKGALIFQTANEWYRREGVLDVQSLRVAWDRLLVQAQEHGYDGVRVAGCVTWLREPEWTDFTRYESDFEESVAGKPMIVLCSYPLATTSAAGILDVAHTHDFALAKREGKWEMLEAPAVRLKQLAARNRQQSAVATLGLAAVRDYDLSALLQRAATLAAETLGTGRSIVWELQPEENVMVMRAHAGWGELPRDAAVPLVKGSAAHHVFTHDEPVVVIDVANDSRFSEKSWLLREHGVTTLLTSLIRGHERPWGALSVHSTMRQAFTADDLDFVQSLANVLALAIERNEHELAERREKEILRTIVDNIPVMIAHTGSDGAILAANPAWEQTLGWTGAETPHCDVRADVLGASDPTWRDVQLHARDGNVIESMSARFALSDGTAMTFGVDVSDRKRAEERFRHLAENIDETFCVLSTDLELLTYLNPAGERLFGRTMESLAARGAWLETVHPDDRACARKSMSGSAPAPEEDFRIVRPDGSLRWVHARTAPLRGFGDRTNQICAVIQDVTERRKAEEERARLLRSEQQARATAECALAKLHSIESITDTALGRMALDELLAELLARLRTGLGTDYAAVFLLDEQRGLLTIRAVEGFPPDRAQGIRPTLDSPIGGRVIREGRAMILDNLDPQRTAAMAAGMEIRSAMGAPLVAEEKIFGVVIVASIEARRFTEDELELLRMVADRVAPAIERGRLVETVRSARERLSSLSRRLLSVQEEERRHLAIELHDELGQLLTAVKMNLGARQLQDASENVDIALQTVRDLALDLRPAMLDDLGLASALRWYADRFARQARVVMHLSIEEVTRLDPNVATACFRVAQEALTNVVRHAHAKNVGIVLRQSGTELELRVRDDGKGFDVDAARDRAAHGASMGLLGMEERVALAGGFIEIHSAPGEGTTVRVLFSTGATA